MKKFHGRAPTFRQLREDENRRQLEELNLVANKASVFLTSEASVFERSKYAFLLLGLLMKHKSLPRPVIIETLGASSLPTKKAGSRARSCTITLERRGYLKSVKGRWNLKPCRWLQITEEGKKAFEERVKCLKKKIS